MSLYQKSQELKLVYRIVNKSCFCLGIKKVGREQSLTQALPSPSRYSRSALEIPELFRTAAHLQICLGVVSMSCQGGVNI